MFITHLTCASGTTVVYEGEVVTANTAAILFLFFGYNFQFKCNNLHTDKQCTCM